MLKLLAIAVTLAFTLAPARSQGVNIQGQTGPRAPAVDSTDMTPGTITFTDRKAPGSTVLNLIIPRAYVTSHTPTGDDGYQYVSLSLVYPELEPNTVVRRRAYALHGSMPQKEYLEVRDNMSSRAAIFLTLTNSYRIPALHEQREQSRSCRTAKLWDGVDEVLPEAINKTQTAQCAELFRRLLYKTERLFAVTTRQGERSLLFCQQDNDPRHVSTSCTLPFTFHGFEWDMKLQPSRARDAAQIINATIDFLTSHVTN